MRDGSRKEELVRVKGPAPCNTEKGGCEASDITGSSSFIYLFLVNRENEAGRCDITWLEINHGYVPIPTVFTKVACWGWGMWGPPLSASPWFLHPLELGYVILNVY